LTEIADARTDRKHIEQKATACSICKHACLQKESKMCYFAGRAHKQRLNANANAHSAGYRTATHITLIGHMWCNQAHRCKSWHYQEWCSGAQPARSVVDVVRGGQPQHDWLSFVVLQLKHCRNSIALNNNHGLEGKLQLVQSCAQLTVPVKGWFVRRRSGSQPVHLVLQAGPC